MLPRTISPECRQRATSVHWDSLTVWPTRSWSTRVGRLFGRIWPSTTSSGSSSSGPGSDAGGGTGTSSSRSEKERSASTLQLPSSRWRCSSSSGFEVGVAQGQLGRGGHHAPDRSAAAARPRRRAAHRDRVRRRAR